LRKENEMKNINDAVMIANKINELNAYAKARVWTAKDDKGNIVKVRVYTEKGFVEIKDDNKANIETVGRNYFDAVKSAIQGAGYSRTYS